MLGDECALHIPVFALEDQIRALGIAEADDLAAALGQKLLIFLKEHEGKAILCAPLHELGQRMLGDLLCAADKHDIVAREFIRTVIRMLLCLARRENGIQLLGEHLAALIVTDKVADVERIIVHMLQPAQPAHRLEVRLVEHIKQLDVLIEVPQRDVQREILQRLQLPLVAANDTDGAGLLKLRNDRGIRNVAVFVRQLLREHRDGVVRIDEILLVKFDAAVRLDRARAKVHLQEVRIMNVLFKQALLEIYRLAQVLRERAVDQAADAQLVAALRLNTGLLFLDVGVVLLLAHAQLLTQALFISKVGDQRNDHADEHGPCAVENERHAAGAGAHKAAHDDQQHQHRQRRQDRDQQSALVLLRLGRRLLDLHLFLRDHILQTRAAVKVRVGEVARLIRLDPCAQAGRRDLLHRRRAEGAVAVIKAEFSDGEKVAVMQHKIAAGDPLTVFTHTVCRADDVRVQCVAIRLKHQNVPPQ